MSKKLKLAKTLPELANDEEAAGFFERQDTSEIWKQIQPVSLTSPARGRRRSSRLSNPLGPTPSQIAQANKIAAAKSIDLGAQLRRWIAEGIRREARRVRRTPAITWVTSLMFLSASSLDFPSGGKSP